MSFETWWVTYKLDDDKLFADWGKDAWDAGRAESEAQIAALQSERDVLKEALSGVVDMVTFEFLGGTADESDYSYCHACGSRWRGNENHLPKCPMFKALALLSTPTSREPARKP